MRIIVNDNVGPGLTGGIYYLGEDAVCTTCNGDMVVRDPDNPVVGNPCPGCTVPAQTGEQR